MAVRVFWAEPSPEAKEARRRYWALADEIAGEILERRALAELAGEAQSGETQQKRREPA